MALKNLEGIELTDLTQKALKWYCDETGEDPKEVLVKAIKQFLELRKIAKANKELKEVLGNNMLTVQVMLYGPFVDFIREYLRFFGDKQTLDTFCTLAVYEKCNSLHNDLTEFVNKKTHGLDAHAWYEKHSHLAITSSQPEDESEE